MKITMIPTLEKSRAPSRNVFCKGLGCETYSSRLLGREDHRWDGGFQVLPVRAVSVDFLHRLDALHELAARVVGLEVCVGQYILNGDKKIFQRNLVVAEMD